MTRIASFHLVRWPVHQTPVALAHLAVDRRPLRRTEGLELWRLLGTGRGDETGPGAQLNRTAMFAVWRGDDALDDFLCRSPIARRWNDASEEAFHVRLRRLGGHGSWRGAAVLDGLQAGSADGPIAVLTRADVHASRWRRFRRAGPAVSEELRAAPGLLAACGIGEAPVGRLGTFSLWRDHASVEAFARTDVHAAVVRRTRAEVWYGEELFARFEPYAAEGTWDGRAPLGAPTPPSAPRV